MNKSEALKVILSDIKQAKKAKKDIDAKIEEWISQYNGELYGNEQDGRSKIVIKDIKKAVEWFIPNAVGPFVDKNRIIKLEGVTAEDVEPAKMHERLLNFQFVRKFDRYNFIHDMFKVASIEGTACIKVGWELEEEEKIERVDGVGYDFIQALNAEGIEYTIIRDKGKEDEETDLNTEDLYNIKIKRVKTLKNSPTAEIIKNGNVFPDPSADKVSDMSFLAYKYEATLSDLKKTGKYTKEQLDEMLLTLKDDDEGLENTRDALLKEYGRDTDYESDAVANKKITVYEYFGHLDMNNDGIAEPIMATIINDKLLDIDDNPFPDSEIPFIIIPFNKIPFSIWGSPIAELIADNQKVRSGLMRGFLDNVSQSNNGKKFVKKGALDAVNKRKYEQNLGGLIEYNLEPGFFDGTFNQLPPSIFNLYELVQQEAESLSGINRTAQGLDSTSLNDSATGAAIQRDMGQKRMIDIIRRYSEGIKILFRKWISMNKEFLSDEEVMRISNMHIPFTRDDISGEFDLEITVGASGVSETKVSQMVTLLQQIGGLSNVATVPDGFFNKILGKIADEWGYPDIARDLEEAKPPQPSEAQIQAQQMELEKAQAEINEKRSKAELNKAKSFDTMSGANSKNVDNKMKAAGIVNRKPAQ